MILPSLYSLGSLSPSVEETSASFVRRVFWKLNADFGEPAQHGLELEGISRASELQLALPPEMSQKYVHTKGLV